MLRGPLKKRAKYDIFAATEVATIEIVVPTSQGEGIPQYPYMAAGSANDSARKGSTELTCHLNVCISYGKASAPLPRAGEYQQNESSEY